MLARIPLRKPSKSSAIHLRMCRTPHTRPQNGGDVRVRYDTGETPMAGDRVKDSAGGLGTVTAICYATRNSPEPSQISIKWDEGIMEIDYDGGGRFALVSRRPGPEDRH